MFIFLLCFACTDPLNILLVSVIFTFRRDAFIPNKTLTGSVIVVAAGGGTGVCVRLAY